MERTPLRASAATWSLISAPSISVPFSLQTEFLRDPLNFSLPLVSAPRGLRAVGSRPVGPAWSLATKFNFLGKDYLTGLAALMDWLSLVESVIRAVARPGADLTGLRGQSFRLLLVLVPWHPVGALNPAHVSENSPCVGSSSLFFSYVFLYY